MNKLNSEKLDNDKTSTAPDVRTKKEKPVVPEIYETLGTARPSS